GGQAGGRLRRHPRLGPKEHRAGGAFVRRLHRPRVLGLATFRARPLEATSTYWRSVLGAVAKLRDRTGAAQAPYPAVLRSLREVLVPARALATLPTCVSSPSTTGRSCGRSSSAR